jgi:predicted Zn-ribbon and HTH transcriptional regulator
MARKPRASEPAERRTTIRSALREALTAGPLGAHELSARVGISEKDVAGHLEHLARSLRQGGERLVVDPARCLGCGFVFRQRTRLSKPSRCPVCKSQHLGLARFSVRATTDRRPG